MTKTAWRCAQCGTVNEPDARACISCGKWPSLFDLQDQRQDQGREAPEKPSEPSPAADRRWRLLRIGLPIVIALAWLTFSFVSTRSSDGVERVDVSAIEETVGATRQPFEDSRACDVYVVPLDRPSETLAAIVTTYVGRNLPVEACLRPSMRIDASAIDEHRGQLNTGSLMDQLALAFQSTLGTRPSTVMGITSLDVFLPFQPAWPYAYGTFDTVGRTQGFSVISSARLGTGDVLIERAEKLAKRDVGLVFFGLPPSLDPESLLYAYFVDLDDLDRMTIQYSNPDLTAEDLRYARKAFLAG